MRRDIPGLEYDTVMMNNHPVDILTRMPNEKTYYFRCACGTQYAVADRYTRTYPIGGREWRSHAHRCPRCGRENQGRLEAPWVRHFAGYLGDDD